MTLPDEANDLSLVCGVGGLVFGYFAYRRSGQMKAIDLRLELRKIDADVHRLLRKLPAHLERARELHEAASTMPDSHQSRAMEPWQADWDAGQERLA